MYFSKPGTGTQRAWLTLHTPDRGLNFCVCKPGLHEGLTTSHLLLNAGASMQRWVMGGVLVTFLTLTAAVINLASGARVLNAQG